MKTKINGILTLLLALMVQMTFAQERTISGVVSDEMGPVADISVKVKGTTRGTVTDFDGNYAIKAKTGDTLEFTHVSYGAVSKVVGASNKIDVMMTESGETLNEVVVTAMGIKRRPDEITTSTQLVKSENLTQASATNISEALTGKVSGLRITTTSNGVNGSKSILLRGLRSFSGNNEALVVIDGIPSTSNVLNAMDPETIANVNVMKGANGAALYGAKGANGLVIVTTKKGVKGKDFRISYKSSTDFENVAYLPERQTRYGQGWASGGQFTHFVYENGAWGPEFDGSMVPVGLPLEDGTYRYMPYETLGSDNIKDFFKTGLTFQNSISLGVGDSDAYVNFSYGNLKQEFIIENDESTKNNFNIRAGKKIGKFNIGATVQYTKTKVDATTASLYGDLLQTATNIDINQFTEPNNSTHWNGYFYSPYWKKENERYEQENDRINTSITIGYDINEHINLTSILSMYDFVYTRNSHNNGFEETDAIHDLSGYARAIPATFSNRNSSSKNKYGQFMAGFDYELTSNWNFNGHLGTSLEDDVYNTTSVSGTGLTIPGLYNISNVETVKPSVNKTEVERTQSIFADATFGFKDYLFINVTGRNDYLSVLDVSNRSFFYPSAGISFVPTKAFDNFGGNILDRLKLSYNYVKVGNASAVGYADINDTYYQPSSSYGSRGNLFTLNNYGTFPMDNNAFIPSTGATDPYIRPEFVTSHEFTLTSEFWKRRITFDVSAYMGTSEDQISNISTSFASGLRRNKINIGQADTKGLELDLGLTAIKTDDFKWYLGFSYATDKMTITKVSDQSDSVAVLDYTDIGIYAEVGEDYPLIKGTDYQRDPNGNVVIDGATGLPLINSELVNLGRATPKYTIGFNTNIKYKGFSFTATTDYRGGYVVYSDLKRQLAWTGNLVESAENGRQEFIFPNSVIETSPGVFVENTNVPTASGGPGKFLNYYSGNYNAVSSNLVINASAFKVREMSLNYDFSSELIKKTGLTNLSVGIHARNPFTILAKENRGYADPESSNQSSARLAGVSTVGNNPPTKVYGFSLNLKF